jgi:hypothetical protein
MSATDDDIDEYLVTLCSTTDISIDGSCENDILLSTNGDVIDAMLKLKSTTYDDMERCLEGFSTEENIITGSFDIVKLRYILDGGVVNVVNAKSTIDEDIERYVELGSTIDNDIEGSLDIVKLRCGTLIDAVGAIVSIKL